jgi:hypothetical protein
VGRALGSLTVAFLGSAALVVTSAFNDPAGATVVSNEAELRAAFGNATETEVDLANDITLTMCVDGAVSRNSATALTLDGHGFTITQTCPERVIRGEGTGALTVRNVTITGGRTLLDGGGVFSEGSLVVENASIVRNRAGDGGGGISGFEMTITNSVVADNRGGTGGGGGISAEDLTMSASTVARNSGEVGGGIATANAALVNSTVTGNTATMLGGGVFLGEGDLEIVYTDVVSNTGATGANINLFAGDSSFESFASVVAEPTGDVNCVVSNVTSHGYNFSDDTTCDFTTSTDRQDAGNPRLAALAENGGPTPTRLPEPDSPLLDAIPPERCQADGAAGVTTDQRGLPRPGFVNCDIGAVEVQPPPLPPAPVPVEPTFTG